MKELFLVYSLNESDAIISFLDEVFLNKKRLNEYRHHTLDLYMVQ